jgi:hypothetical protein
VRVADVHEDDHVLAVRAPAMRYSGVSVVPSSITAGVLGSTRRRGSSRDLELVNVTDTAIPPLGI